MNRTRCRHRDPLSLEVTFLTVPGAQPRVQVADALDGKRFVIRTVAAFR